MGNKNEDIIMSWGLYGGDWPATNEPRTGDVEAACSGQIGMAETRDNGYVYDELPKKKKAYTTHLYKLAFTY